jgi:hypothetical protein
MRCRAYPEETKLMESKPFVPPLEYLLARDSLPEEERRYVYFRDSKRHGGQSMSTEEIAILLGLSGEETCELEERAYGLLDVEFKRLVAG